MEPRGVYSIDITTFISVLHSKCTQLNIEFSFSLSSCSNSSMIWAYGCNVIFGSACPSLLLTDNNWTPFANRILAWVCLIAWNVISLLIPALFNASCNALLIALLLTLLNTLCVRSSGIVKVCNISTNLSGMVILRLLLLVLPSVKSFVKW